MLFCCFCLRWVCLTLNILGFGTLGVVWALMVVAYYKDDGRDCPRLSDRYHFGAGFALFVSTWCRDIFSIISLLLCCHSADSGKRKVANQNQKEQ
ncbi:amastin-like protein [Leishmania donovani]|nr:amastin-like protein [Leishmania donovani]CBZ31920.1 amastin-like protein [Leishmania donovani]